MIILTFSSLVYVNNMSDCGESKRIVIDNLAAYDSVFYAYTRLCQIIQRNEFISLLPESFILFLFCNAYWVNIILL